jgi:hypothetical protein
MIASIKLVPDATRIFPLLARTACAGGALLLTGCESPEQATRSSQAPAALVAAARPIGRGAHFHPRATGPVVGPCKTRLGRRYGVHVELFADNRVMLIPRGIGSRPPRQYSAGRITRARCFGDLVTIEPTGVVLVRRGSRLRLSDLFRSWGQRLSSHRLASFPAPGGDTVKVFVAGRRWSHPPASVPLTPHAEIVLELGPYVPPHVFYEFPPGT